MAYHPGEWSDEQAEETLYSFLMQDSGHPELIDDDRAQDLFDTGWFDPDATQVERRDAQEDLVEYLWYEYGIDFDEAFDWIDYREWYESQ